MNDIYAGIVTYNPVITILKENVDAIHNQVFQVIIFDNGSNNIEDIKKISSEITNIIVLESPENLGIAAALNKLMQWGYENNYDWMLSLDQDSICPNNYISAMRPYLMIEENLGIVAPIIIDRNISIVGHNPKAEYAHVNTCITSGAFSKISAWKKIGKYDESMFIDSVDFEFCYRMRKKGYGIIQVSSMRLVHKLGNSKKRQFLLWRVNVTDHSAFRKYYMARNNVYYPLKHHLWLYFIRGNFRNLWLLFIVNLYEDDKKNKKRSILRGWRDGLYLASKYNSI